MIKFLIEKEFKQLLRNSFMPKLILIFPCMMMLLMPWAADLEIKNINLCVVDNDHTTYSERLIRKTSASGYFRLTGVADAYEEAMEFIEKGKADIILEIPAGFEEELVKTGTAGVMISANTVNGTKGGMGSSYLASIVNDFGHELGEENSGTADSPGNQIYIRYFFNPYLNYKAFMIPALMVVVLTLLCGFLPALNIVEEKEKGTIEQINVTPVSKFTFILAKLIPYWITGFAVLSICFLLAKVIYGISPTGNPATLYLCSALFILLISEFGLIISNYSSTMQQAMFVMFFFIIILILMSGLFTPVSSMAEWARTIVFLNPLKYFIEIMRMVYLKGSGITDLGRQLFALCCFTGIFGIWAILSYKKRE